MRAYLPLFLLVVAHSLCAQTFRGHQVGESVGTFFDIEIALKAKLQACQADAPRELTPDEIKQRYGTKTLKEFEKKRSNDPPGEHTGILSNDRDIYGDRCGALVDLARLGVGRIDGTGYSKANKFSKALRERISTGNASDTLLISKGEAETSTWRGRDPEQRDFLFKDGRLELFSFDVLSIFTVVEADVSRKLAVTPTEVAIHRQNTYGASWKDLQAEWNTAALHVNLFVSHNPALTVEVPRLTLYSQADYARQLEKDQNRPSSID